MGALGTELRGRGRLGPAIRAGPGQGSGALLAELRLRAVLVLAPRTRHLGPLPCRSAVSVARALGHFSPLLLPAPSPDPCPPGDTIWPREVPVCRAPGTRFSGRPR